MPHPAHQVRAGRALAVKHFTAKRLTHHQNRCCDKDGGKHNDSAKNRPCCRAGAINGPAHAESLGHEQARIFGRPVKNAQLPMIIIVDKHGIARLHSKEYTRSSLAIHHAYRNRCNHHRDARDKRRDYCSADSDNAYDIQLKGNSHDHSQQHSAAYQHN